MTSDNSPSRSLIRADVANLPTTLGPELEEAAGYARAEKSDATTRAYRSDFALFRSWCETKRVLALPAAPEAVAAFLAAEANRDTKVATISRRLWEGSLRLLIGRWQWGQAKFLQKLIVLRR